MYREIACICAKKVIEEDHSFEQVEALIVFFSLQRYPEHLGLLCGSKNEAHGALYRAQPSEHHFHAQARNHQM
jgi:hypothetical protein